MGLLCSSSPGLSFPEGRVEDTGLLLTPRREAAKSSSAQELAWKGASSTTLCTGKADPRSARPAAPPVRVQAPCSGPLAVSPLHLCSHRVPGLITPPTLCSYLSQFEGLISAARVSCSCVCPTHPHQVLGAQREPCICTNCRWAFRNPQGSENNPTSCHLQNLTGSPYQGRGPEGVWLVPQIEAGPSHSSAMQQTCTQDSFLRAF